MLINLARDTFAHAGWGETLLRGRYTFKLGESPRNVAEEPADVGERVHGSL